MYYDTSPSDARYYRDSRGYQGPSGSRQQSPSYFRDLVYRPYPTHPGPAYHNTYPRQLPYDGCHQAPLPFRPIATNLPSTRYGDGEVTRYGAGESYRPFNRDRSPRRSPPPSRRRSRTPVRDARRSPPPPASDSYVPSRTPRRRSRSPDRIIGGDRYRAAPPSGGERWRGRDRSRSRERRSPPPRRFSPRRTSPRRSPGRYSPPRRDDRDRARSPPRIRDNRFAERRLTPRVSDLALNRRRSRSPHDRDMRDPRDLRDAGLNTYRPRSPRRVPSSPRGSNTYRPRSRTPERRDDRYNPGLSTYRRSPPPKESNISSAKTSRSASRRNSPGPPSVRVKEETPIRSPPPPTPTTSIPVREAPKPAMPERTPPPARSPPRGPAALRGPVPTGPSAARNVSVPVASPMQQQRPFPPTAPASRPDMSPSIPPAGPRGYVPRGGFGAPRGGRGSGWNAGPPRPMPPPAPTPTGPNAANNGIPTGPRATSISGPSGGSPSLQSRPFNPPTGPAAQQATPARPTLVQSLMNTQPPLVPGGRADPSLTPLVIGVTKDLEGHTLKLKQDEEKIREELNAKREKLRKSLHGWNRLERESKVASLRSELTEESLAKVAGEVGGNAF